MLFSRLALATGLLTVNVAALLDKPSLWPNLNFLGEQLSNLPATSSQVTAWAGSSISQVCRDRAVSEGVDPSTMKQYSVALGDVSSFFPTHFQVSLFVLYFFTETTNYSQCSVVWYICQEAGSPNDINLVAATWAKVPVRMRQWVNELVILKNTGSAYALAYNIVFKGTDNSLGLMIHESTHCVDFGVCNALSATCFVRNSG